VLSTATNVLFVAADLLLFRTIYWAWKGFK